MCRLANFSATEAKDNTHSCGITHVNTKYKDKHQRFLNLELTLSTCTAIPHKITNTSNS